MKTKAKTKTKKKKEQGRKALFNAFSSRTFMCVRHCRSSDYEVVTFRYKTVTRKQGNAEEAFEMAVLGTREGIR